jgi:hypothetical protein
MITLEERAASRRSRTVFVKQSAAHYDARSRIIDYLVSDGLKGEYNIRVAAPRTLADDPSGDALDALLCAVQVAWAWKMRDSRYGAPHDSDILEGWIADPSLLSAQRTD